LKWLTRKLSSKARPRAPTKICGETCCKNLICLKSEIRSETYRECAIEDVGERREDTEISMRENSRAITPSRRDVRKHARRNAEKGEDEKSCVFYSDTINSNQSSTRLPVAPIEPSKFIAYI